MDSIELALKELRLSDTPNISAVAKAYNVNRLTLSRRFNGVSQSIEKKAENQQFLSPQQERTLIQEINRLTERGFPPTVSVIRNTAAQIARKEPGSRWS